METKALVLRHWDDVVFENRNKLYGAYSLRRAYNQRIMTGFGVSVAVAIILLFLPKFLPHSKPVDIERAPYKGKVKVTEYFPLKRDIEIPKDVAAPKKTTQANTTPVVVQHTVIDGPTDQPTQPVTDGVEGGTVDNSLPVIGTGTGLSEVPTVLEPPKVVDIAEVMPTYEGGMEAMMKFIQKKMRYPYSAQLQQIEGTVYVRFIVNGDGTVSNVEVMRGIHRDCDEEAVRVISMLKSWKGGSQNGNPVGVRMVLPIKFSLGKR